MKFFGMFSAVLAGVFCILFFVCYYYRHRYFMRSCRKHGCVAIGTLQSSTVSRKHGFLTMLRHGSGTSWYVSYLYEACFDSYLWTGRVYQTPMRIVRVYYKSDDMEHAKIEPELAMSAALWLLWPIAAGCFLLAFFIYLC